MERIRNGLTLNGYRITGDNYFFINYYVLPLAKITKDNGERRRVLKERKGSTAEADNNSKQSRTLSLPHFYAKHYEYFHYLELCESYGYDSCAAKSRGVGFSEIAASIGVCRYTAIAQAMVVYAAFSKHYLIGDGVLVKAWRSMDKLNTETQNGFKQLRQQVNSIMKRRASMIDREGNEYGSLSEINGLVVDNPRKLRGTRTNLLFFEEAGSFSEMLKAYTQSEALVDIQGERVGTRVVWGTGGDSGESILGLQTMFPILP